MKKGRIKSWLCFVLSVVMTVPLFGLGNLVSFAEDKLYLTKLGYSTVNTIAGELSFDSNITIGEESFIHGIYIHPTSVGEEGAASIVYILDSSYSRFSTWVGKNAAGNGWGNNPMQFEIYVDGNLMAQSEILQYPDKEKLEIDLPENATELKLVAKATGDSHFACGATFAEPILTLCSGNKDAYDLNSDGVVNITDVTALLDRLSGAEDQIYLTELEYSGANTITGEISFDSNITIGEESFIHGIYIHPTSAGETGAASIVYILDGSYSRFSTWVGKNAAGNDWGNNPMQFEIYVDGNLMAQSEILQYPDKEKLEIDLPENATELKLVAKATGDSHFACGATFADPILTCSGSGGTDVYDLNGDEVVNITDVTALLDRLSEG